MNPGDIKDEESLRDWLNARPEGTRAADALAIAQRSALRALPMWSGRMDAP